MRKKAPGPNARRALAIVLLAGAAPLAAQTPASPPADPNAPPPSETPPATPQGARSFTPADFARFAPRTAL